LAFVLIRAHRRFPNQSPNCAKIQRARVSLSSVADLDLSTWGRSIGSLNRERPFNEALRMAILQVGVGGRPSVRSSNNTVRMNLDRLLHEVIPYRMQAADTLNLAMRL